MTTPSGAVEDGRFDPAALDMIRRLGSGALLARMIDIFLEQSQERITAARTGVSTHDLRAVQLAAHSLKSSAAQLGGIAVQRASAAVEKAAADGDAPPLASGIERIAEEFEHLRQWLEGIRAQLATDAGAVS